MNCQPSVIGQPASPTELPKHRYIKIQDHEGQEGTEPGAGLKRATGTGYLNFLRSKDRTRKDQFHDEDQEEPRLRQDQVESILRLEIVKGTRTFNYL